VNSLERLGKAAWLRLTPSSVHFIIIPDSQGTQVWSYGPYARQSLIFVRNLRIEVLFESDYVCTSAANNTINLEIPLDTLHRALKSCSSTADTSLRLTKRNNMAYLALASSLAVLSMATCLMLGQRNYRECYHPSYPCTRIIRTICRHVKGTRSASRRRPYSSTLIKRYSTSGQ